MKFDYKKFKKVAADKETTTLEHENGHQIRIAHSKLSKENQQELHGIPMFASGGEVANKQVGPLEDAQAFDINAPAMMSSPDNMPSSLPQSYIETMPQEAPTSSIGQRLSDAMPAPGTSLGATIGSIFGPAGTAIGGAIGSNLENEPAKPKYDTSTPDIPKATSGAAMPAGPDMYSRGVKEMEAGLRAGADVTAAQGKSELAAAEEKSKQLAMLQQHYNDSYQELDNSRKELMDDIKNGHIDPNHYMDSKSDLGKISTAIGLLMGGIGGGAQGMSNPAMDFINKQIDRDIESQKANLGKKQNLLSATMQQFGNLKDATAMAKVYQTDIYASKMEEAMATAKSPMAKAALQKAIGELHMTTGPIMQEMATKKAILSGLQSGAAAPSQAVAHVVPKEQRDAAYKEIAQVENMNKAIKDIEKYGAEMSQIQTLGNRLKNPFQSESQINSMNTKVMGAMHSILGTLSESDKKLAEANTIFMKDDAETVRTKIAELKNLATAKGSSTPVLDAHGIRMNKLTDAKAPKSAKGFPDRK